MTAANTKSHDEIGCLSVPLFEKWLGLGGCLWLETRALFSDQQPSRYIGDEELSGSEDSEPTFGNMTTRFTKPESEPITNRKS